MRDGKLSHVDTLALTGSVKSMEIVRIPNQSKDSVVILTERDFFCILAYDATNKKVLCLMAI